MPGTLALHLLYLVYLLLLFDFSVSQPVTADFVLLCNEESARTPVVLMTLLGIYMKQRTLV